MKHWLETRQVFDRLAALRAAGTRAALATVVRVQGSAYRHEGARLVVGEDDSSTGNVSGGCLEQDVREVARRVIRTGVAELRRYCGSADEIAAWDLGVGCEGVVDILVEPTLGDRDAERRLLRAERPFVVVTRLHPVRTDDDPASYDVPPPAGELQRTVLSDEAAAAWADGGSRLVEQEGVRQFIDVLTPPPRLLVVSAAEDARHLARLADGIGFRVVVADRRPALLDPACFPAGVRLVESEAALLGERVVLAAGDFAVVMTHQFADDAAYLRALLASPARYLGVLGPRQRTERMLDLLRRDGPVDAARIFGPVGLDIGTDGAEQVALSIVAEMLAVRGGRAARSLRERTAPIHADAG